MINIITYLDSLTDSDDTYIVALLIVILIVSILDSTAGWLNAVFNENVEFVSGKATYGIIKKMVYYITLITFMAVAILAVPKPVALSAIYTLYFAYLYSEGRSLFAHLGLTDDGKKNEPFIEFLKRLKDEMTKGDRKH